jgi:hypothetical protein
MMGGLAELCGSGGRDLKRVLGVDHLDTFATSRSLTGAKVIRD